MLYFLFTDQAWRLIPTMLRCTITGLITWRIQDTNQKLYYIIGNVYSKCERLWVRVPGWGGMWGGGGLTNSLSAEMHYSIYIQVRLWDHHTMLRCTISGPGTWKINLKLYYIIDSVYSKLDGLWLRVRVGDVIGLTPCHNAKMYYNRANYMKDTGHKQGLK